MVTYLITSFVGVTNQTHKQYDIQSLTLGQVPATDFAIIDKTLPHASSFNTMHSLQRNHTSGGYPGSIHYDVNVPDRLKHGARFTNTSSQLSGRLPSGTKDKFYNGFGIVQNGVRKYTGFISGEGEERDLLNLFLNSMYQDWTQKSSNLPFEFAISLHVETSRLPASTTQQIAFPNKKQITMTRIQGQDTNGKSQIFYVAAYRSRLQDFFTKVVWQKKYDGADVLTVKRTWEFRKLNVGLTALTLIGLILLIVAATNNWFKGKN